MPHLPFLTQGSVGELWSILVDVSNLNPGEDTVSKEAWKALWESVNQKMKLATEKILAPRSKQHEMDGRHSSRIEILRLLQKACPPEFLRKHKINGPDHIILRHNNRESLEKIYTAWLDEANNFAPGAYVRSHARWPSIREKGDEYDEYGEPLPDRYYDRDGNEVDPMDVDMDEEGMPVLRREEEEQDQPNMPLQRLQEERDQMGNKQPIYRPVPCQGFERWTYGDFDEETYEGQYPTYDAVDYDPQVM